MLIKAMREDLTRFGVEETRTPEELDSVIQNTKGTVMIVVNSVCGCAAGLARPAIGMALKHPNVPDKVVTVFAGADIAATERARGYFKGYFPS
jgi:putative YphP/YqiW family bacilliredoxin